MKRIFLIGASLFISLSALAAPERFYLGTYTSHSTSQGIYTGTFDPDTGKLGPLILAVQAPDPNFLALSPDGRFLFAAQGLDNQGAVGAYAVQPDNSLKLINQQASGGTAVCHVSLDGTGRVVLVANYSTGNIASFPIAADGSIGPAASTIKFEGSGPNKSRQSAPHAHSIYVSPDNMFVYSCDLGTDHVWIFHLDSAKATLTPADPPFALVPPGSGPRHLVFGKGGDIVYVVNEMGCSVSTFIRDKETGTLSPEGTASCLPIDVASNPKFTAAEIAMHPSGRWIYVSVRGCDIITALLPVRCAFIQSVPAGVKQTRQFAIDPSGRWLITAGQADNRLAVLSIDLTTGLLSATGESASVGAPVCVLFDPVAKN